MDFLPQPLSKLLAQTFIVIALAAGSCTPPIESRIALSDPGETPVDERLVGVWWVDGKADEWGQTLINISLDEETSSLRISISASHPELGRTEVFATAHPSDVAGAPFLNIRRLAGFGIDYTRIEPGTCQLVHPDQEPGYIIARWEMPDDDSLRLYLLGRDPSEESSDERRKAADALGDRLRALGVSFREVNILEFSPISSEVRAIIEASRQELAAAIATETPDALFARSSFEIKNHDGPPAVLRRVSRDPSTFWPDEPGYRRHRDLQQVMALQIDSDDFSGAVVTAKQLLQAATCFEARPSLATVTAEVVVHMAGAGDRSTAARITDVAALALAQTDYRSRTELQRLISLLFKQGDRRIAEIVLLRMIEAEAQRIESMTVSRFSPSLGDMEALFNQIARAYQRDGDQAAAQSLLERAVVKYPADRKMPIFFAELQNVLGLGADAVFDTLAQAADAERGSTYALVSIAEKQAHYGDVEGSFQTLDRAVAAAPVSGWVTLQQEVQAHISARDHDAAMMALRRASGIPDIRHSSLPDKAAQQLAERDVEGALKTLEEIAIATAQRATQNFTHVAEAYLALGEPLRARAVLRRIDAGMPVASHLLSSLIDLQIELGEKDAALRNIDRYRTTMADGDGKCPLNGMTAQMEWHAALREAAPYEVLRGKIADMPGDQLVDCSGLLRRTVDRLDELGEAVLSRTIIRRAAETAIAAPRFVRYGFEQLTNWLRDTESGHHLKQRWEAPNAARLVEDAAWLHALAGRAEADGIARTDSDYLRLMAATMYADGNAIAPALDILTDLNLDSVLSAASGTSSGVFVSASLALIAAAQSRTGDGSGARQTLGRIDDLSIDIFAGKLRSDILWFRSLLIFGAADALASRGEEALARETLVQAGSRVTSALGQIVLFEFLAEAQYNLGDRAGARETVRQRVAAILQIERHHRSDSLPKGPSLVEGLTEIGADQLGEGDIEGARETAKAAYDAAMRVPMFAR